MEARYIGLRAAIRSALASCVQSFPNPKKGKYEEPDYTAGIVTELPKVLTPCGVKWGLRFGGCFIHQSPRISYQNDSGELKSCELGDLLIICHDSREDRLNAALLQLKMDETYAPTIVPEEKQLYVYMNWPEIIWKKKQKSYCIIPKTVSQGALYGVVHPLNNNGRVVGAKVKVASASREIPTNGQSFEDYLYDVIDFRAGRTFVEHSKVTGCDGWSMLISDLCDHMETAVYNRANIRQVNSDRGVGGLFAFLRQRDVEELQSIAKSELNNHSSSISEEDDEHGHLGVLYVERGWGD